MLKGFKDFIMRGNAIDLAVGVVIGGAFSAVITAIVNGFISPLIAAIFGKPNFDAIWTFNIGQGQFALGTILTAVVNFLLIAVAIYFCIVVPMNKLNEFEQKRHPKAEETPAATELDVLQDIKTLLEKQTTEK